jgi:[ribosomal protein S5]-alanine N-acetyltransferase
VTDLVDSKNQPTMDSLDLELVSMSAEFIQAMIDGQGEPTPGYEGVRFWDKWSVESDPGTRIRLIQLQTMPELQPWLMRAIVRQSDHQMVGHVGFHTPPGPQYLKHIAPAGLEVGYSVFPPFRRRGYVSAAVFELINWAHSGHGVNEFVASINHENVASQAVATKLGFEFFREFDPTDPDREDIYLLRL